MTSYQARDRDEGGVTVVELTVVMAILALVLVALGSVLGSAQRAENVAQSESASVDVARTAADQIQRDIRNAIAVATCLPTGYCLKLYAQLPNGILDQVRYRAVQSSPPSGPTTLYRDSACNATYTTCGTTRTLATNLANHAQSKAMLSCVSSTTLPHVDLVLLVTPLNAYASGALTMQSTSRPRNVTTAFC